MTIRLLADVPESIEILARWFHEEWQAFDSRSTDSIAAQLRENLNRDSVPMTEFSLGLTPPYATAPAGVCDTYLG